MKPWDIIFFLLFCPKQTTQQNRGRSLGTRFSGGLGSGALVVGPTDLRGILQPKQFGDVLS